MTRLETKVAKVATGCQGFLVLKAGMGIDILSQLCSGNTMYLKPVSDEQTHGTSQVRSIVQGDWV